MATRTITRTTNSVVRIRKDAEVISAAQTLVSGDSGKVFILDGTVGAAVTLPTLANGLNFKFIIGSTFITSNWAITSSEGDNITGNIIVNGGAIPAAAEDLINFAFGAETVGDWVELVADSDNSQWIVTGIGNATGAITATDPA